MKEDPVSKHKQADQNDTTLSLATWMELGDIVLGEISQAQNGGLRALPWWAE